MPPGSTAAILSRVQFGFAVSFHIVCPAFAIGLAVLEAPRLKADRDVFRTLFDFPLRVFAAAIGVVSDVVLAFRFGSNWSGLSCRSGPMRRVTAVSAVVTDPCRTRIFGPSWPS